jgi:hypothetical protein
MKQAMMTRIYHAAIGELGIALIVFIAIMTPPIWKGLGGRDFQPQATTMAVLLVLFAGILRGVFRWPVVDFGIILLVTEITTLLIINHVFGAAWYGIFNLGNLWWFGFINLFTGLPWIVGFCIGSIWCRKSLPCKK